MFVKIYSYLEKLQEKKESWAIAKTTARCAHGCPEKFRESWLVHGYFSRNL